jgi:hypothetical protein
VQTIVSVALYSGVAGSRLTLAPMPLLAPVIMTTLPAIESSGFVGSIEGYWSRETFLVNCMLVTKKSTGRDSMLNKDPDTKRDYES